MTVPVSAQTAPTWAAALRPAQAKANTNRRLLQERERTRRRQQRVVAAWLRSLGS